MNESKKVAAVRSAIAIPFHVAGYLIGLAVTLAFAAAGLILFVCWVTALFGSFGYWHEWGAYLPDWLEWVLMPEWHTPWYWRVLYMLSVGAIIWSVFRQVLDLAMALVALVTAGPVYLIAFLIEGNDAAAKVVGHDAES